MRFLGSALALAVAVYAFVVIVDPWGVLPLSPPLPRVPVSSNARFTMPALARSAGFDSAVVGSSSSRLLRPDELNAAFGGRFVNLAMNAATAWEQSQVLGLFARTHPAARTVLIGLDGVWCTETPERLTGRPFPEWMYQGSAWRGYAHMFNLYAVQEAGSELWTMLGLKRERYGRDGYTSFVPPDSAYDPARVAAAFARWEVPAVIPATYAPHVLPTMTLLQTALSALPPGTRKVLFVTPSHVSFQGVPGSDYAAMLAACKVQVSQVASLVANTAVVDFLIPSPITLERSSYWDPVHTRAGIASRVIVDLAQTLAGHETLDAKRLR